MFNKYIRQVREDKYIVNIDIFYTVKRTFYYYIFSFRY